MFLLVFVLLFIWVWLIVRCSCLTLSMLLLTLFSLLLCVVLLVNLCFADLLDCVCYMFTFACGYLIAIKLGDYDLVGVRFKYLLCCLCVYLFCIY